MSLNIGTIYGHIAPDCPEKMSAIPKGDKLKHTFLIDGRRAPVISVILFSHFCAFVQVLI